MKVNDACQNRFKDPEYYLQKGLALESVVILTAFVGLFIFGLLGYDAYQRSQRSEIVSTSPAVSVPTTTVATAENPFDNFSRLIEGGIYKVKTSGKVEYSSQTSDVISSSSLDLSNSVIYLDNGKVVRAEQNNPQNPAVYLITQDTVVVLDPERKTYTKFAKDSDFGQFALKAARLLYPPKDVASAIQSQQVQFDKVMENVWEGNWQLENPLEKTPNSATLRVTFSSETGLITGVDYKFEGGNWQQTTYDEYEEIDNTTLAPLLEVPSGYTEESF